MEFNNLDFKENWPEISKLAKHILSMGNCHGGCIVIGVKEENNKTLNPIGINQIQEKSDITKKLSRFIPNSIEYEILQFAYEETEYPKIKGKKFQVLIVEYDPKIIPLLARKDGESINNNRVYVRRKTESTEANYEELQH